MIDGEILLIIYRFDESPAFQTLYIPSLERELFINEFHVGEMNSNCCAGRQVITLVVRL